LCVTHANTRCTLHDLLEYYARRAGEYERVYAKPERQSDLAVLRDLVRGELAGRSVLELAAGTGYWTRVVAPVARSVLATDAAEEPLAMARARAYAPGRVTFAVADAFDLAAVPGEFDAALAAFWWSHVPRAELPRFLGGLRARLGAGARVVLFDNRFVPGSSTPVAHTSERGDTFQLRRLDDGGEYRVLKNFPDETEIRRAVAPVAADVRCVQLEYYWLLAYTTADADGDPGDR